MFYLHVANRTEELLQQLAAVLDQDRQSPFSEELFLVQSRGMERVVCQGLAASLDIFCNYRFFFPLEFLHFVAKQLGLVINLDGFDRNIMVWRLEALLRDIDDPVYQPISGYLEGNESSDNRFQLARRLADCFDQYQLMRGEMIRGWQEGKTATESPAEKWQMHLWQRLLEQSEDADDNFSRTVLFKDITETLRQADENEFTSILPHRISVFGVHILPPVFLDYLDAFSCHANVHFYLLSPCKEYWGDIKSRGTQLREMLKKNMTQEEGFTGHPLLGSLGRQGRDLQNMMVNMDISMEFSSYVDPVKAAEENGRSASILEVLQRDLLYGGVSDTRLVPDDSLRIVSCHSRVRELEVLHEHILQLLDENDSLQLRQMVVMAPDIQEYAPFIPAIFHDIAHSVADRSLQLGKPAIAAFSFFLSLFSGKFGRSSVLELLQCQGVAERFSINRTDMEKIIQWTEDAGIRWGLSADQRGRMGAEPFDYGSFRAGLDRLLMGYAIDCDDFIEDILPFPDIEGKQAQALGGLCQFVEFLEKTAQSFEKSRSLSQWRDLLLSCVEQLLISQESSGEEELRKLLFSLGESEKFTGAHNIDFSVIEKWFAAKVGESRSSSGFLRGQLTFCSMLPMRSIPFQAVCLLGLNDGVFPKSDRKYPFDLLSESSRPGDRSPANDDRYQFLEAILAARQTLYLSYTGQSEKTGESIPPSVVISELLDVFERDYGLKIEVVVHPLYPFASRYFDGSSDNFFTYSKENLDIARMRQQAEKTEETFTDSVFPWWRGRTFLELETVSIGELISFYKDPPAWFINHILGISPRAGQGEMEDREIFFPDALTRYILDNGLFSKIFYEERGWSEEKLLGYFQQSGLWPLGVPGQLSFHSSFTEIKALASQAEKLKLGKKIQDVSLALMPCSETARLKITGRITDRYERGNLIVFSGRLKGAHLLSAWITHLLDNFQREEIRPTWLLTKTNCGCFSELPGEDALSLLSLLELWQKGIRSPLPLYTEPALAWAASSDTKDAALNNAMKKAQALLPYKPEWALLLGNKAIKETLADPGHEFYRYADEIITPLYTLFQQGDRS